MDIGWYFWENNVKSGTASHKLFIFYWCSNEISDFVKYEQEPTWKRLTTTKKRPETTHNERDTTYNDPNLPTTSKKRRKVTNKKQI